MKLMLFCVENVFVQEYNGILGIYMQDIINFENFEKSLLYDFFCVEFEKKEKSLVYQILLIKIIFQIFYEFIFFI